MPLHDFLCKECGDVKEMHVPHAVDSIICGLCFGERVKVFLSPPMSFVREDVRYTSPIDGRPITTYQQHLEDLARSDCVLYEAGIKQDQERNARMRDERLERSVDETVDREIALMPAVKKEKLVVELEKGISAEPVRMAPLRGA